MERISLDGQVAIITGAGAGIGRAEALDFARRGARVVVNDLGREADGTLRADRVVAEITGAGGRAIADHGSVTAPNAGDRLLAAALDEFGQVDVLVNNAGFLRPGPFEELTEDRIDQVISVHLRAAFLVTQPVWRHMQQRGYGRVVMTSSSSGMFGNPANSSYSAAKAGLYGLTKALAYEGQPHGIKVNCLLPFAVTSISGIASEPSDIDPGIRRYREIMAAARGAAGRSMSAAQRAWRSDPATVAPMVSYLASPACAVSGEAYSTCSGRFARVFVGVADGWLATQPSEVTAEAIAAHLNEIRDVGRSSVPMWIFDESAAVVERVADLEVDLSS